MDNKGEPRLKARKCFGHMGGKVADRIFERLIELEWFQLEEGKSTVYVLTEKGYKELINLGVNLN